MKLIRCTQEHTEAIRAILNEVISSSNAIYDSTPRTQKKISDWIGTKNKNDIPILGLETADGLLAGFASYGPFRDRPGFRYTIEHTLCIHQEFRKQGCGKRLITELISEAIRQKYHVMIGAVDAENSASIALHQQMGFTHCGHIEKAGYKFERWLDLDFFQLILPKPAILPGES